jgi:signal recognition particle subunit SRP54
MFENLSDKLQKVFKDLRGYGKLTPENIDGALREVRLALLEADVNYTVVKEFIAAVAEQAVGQEVLDSLTPGQQVIKIVHQELVELLGGQTELLKLDGRQPVIIMLAGLQGSGKTTTAAKLAKLLKSKGRRPYLIPADVYRPAAIDQLHVLGESIGVDVHPSEASENPVTICRNAVIAASEKDLNTLIIDTAGRLHIEGAPADKDPGRTGRDSVCG